MFFLGSGLKGEGMGKGRVGWGTCVVTVVAVGACDVFAVEENAVIEVLVGGIGVGDVVGRGRWGLRVRDGIGGGWGAIGVEGLKVELIHLDSQGGLGSFGRCECIEIVKKVQVLRMERKRSGLALSGKSMITLGIHLKVFSLSVLSIVIRSFHVRVRKVVEEL